MVVDRIYHYVALRDHKQAQADAGVENIPHRPEAQHVLHIAREVADRLRRVRVVAVQVQRLRARVPDHRQLVQNTRPRPLLRRNRELLLQRQRLEVAVERAPVHIYTALRRQKLTGVFLRLFNRRITHRGDTLKNFTKSKINNPPAALRD